MVDTSYNSGYAPYAVWSTRQAPIPATVHNLPATIAANGTAQSSLIISEGFSLISVGVTASQPGILSVQRYLDIGATVTQGAAVQTSLAPNVAANIDILDGKPFAAFKVTLTNNSGSLSTLSNLAILVQAGGQNSTDNAVDGSTILTTGNLAQTLFAGAVPLNGYAVYNPDSVNDLWLSDSATAAINGAGSVRIVANGGGYETPPGYRPVGAVSVIGAATGQKITARRW